MKRLGIFAMLGGPPAVNRGRAISWREGALLLSAEMLLAWASFTLRRGSRSFILV